MRWRFGMALAVWLAVVTAAHGDCGLNNVRCHVGQLGDFSLDGDVDAEDLALWAACRSGPNIPVPETCCRADLDGDGDVDQDDFGILQRAYTGSCSCPATPPPAADFTLTPYLGKAPLLVTFDARGSAAPTACYRWDFGDGTIGAGIQTNHNYAVPGSFTVKLTITQAGVLIGAAESVVTVADGTFNVNAPVTANEARRFLWQAGFGPKTADINYIVANGYAAWIDAQVASAATTMPPSYLDQSIQKNYGYGPDSIWDDVCVDSTDQLRQRMAWALLQILVMNDPQDSSSSDMVYYSAYISRALGNYRDLLGYVTHSHPMGVFLTYIGNMKADPSTGSVPDENYAREVMQLFSIGLWQLNADGTRTLDASGNPIPTYDNNTVKQFARVFTGFNWASDYTGPMNMAAGSHEFGAKQLLVYSGVIPPSGYISAITVPAQQTQAAALADIDAALDNIFNHPNCAPFISKLLIQRLVTSNPTPGYVQRVADAFAGSGPYGTGTRGNLAATAKAILLDEEARDPAYRANPYYGKLMEPLVVRWGLYRVLARVDRPAEVFPFRIAADTYQVQLDLGESFLGSPSVFNFYLPDYIPPQTDLAAAGMYAPELQIYNDYTAMAIENRFIDELINASGAQESGRYNDWRALSGNPATLVAALNDELMFGTLSPEATQIIVNALTGITGSTDRVRTAVWLITNSPEFRSLK